MFCIVAKHSMEMQIIQEMNKTKIIVPNLTASMIIHTKVLKLIIEEKNPIRKLWQFAKIGGEKFTCKYCKCVVIYKH